MRFGLTLFGRACLALFACLHASAVLAQNVSLEGRVTDPQGGTVNGALVTMNSPAGPRTTRTGVDGTFFFGDVTIADVVQLAVGYPQAHRRQPADDFVVRRGISPVHLETTR
jgi:hypothetical protein